ncbi:MAG: YfiR family protein [Cyclobacteriaceae bacterium]|nr:YfiR family protein [Cyclobacteriaceae bacterium]
MKKLVFLLMLAGATAITRAQERPEHEIHAAMLFNFIKYVQWPDEGAAGDFVVGVMGEDNVFNTLKAWYDGKPKGAKKYVIKKLTSADEAAACHVVYLGKSKSKEFDSIKAAISGKPVLTVTDGTGLGQKGSCINFRIIDGKLKWELNQSTVTSSNLKVSGQLASMSILI